MTDGDTDGALIVRAGLGIDEVAYLGDEKAWVPGDIDDVEVDTAAGSVTYVYDDENGDPSREIVLCTSTDLVRAVRLNGTPENAAHETLDGVGLSFGQSETEAVLGTPFADGVDASTGWFVISYEGPFPNAGISFAFVDGDRSRMVRIEVYGPLCP